MNAFIRTAALLACAGVVQVAQAAAPSATSLTPGFSFQAYTGAAPVGEGSVDTRDTLFFIDEQAAAGLKSWYIFFDPKGPQIVDAVLTFDRPIVDVFTTRAQLDGSNATYGIDVDGDSVMNDYGTHRFIGLEPSQVPFGDSITWTAGSNTVHLRFDALDPGDHVRVLVAVPEPSSHALLAAGLGLLAYLAARRRR
ncbi:PEP-CTERM sorting domain-containing protein [Ideonella sp. BN130291]|uniref:PEP-CTERM sorting domain-containing protein n=1 Tax=Ideonella sp. BN130291 TaxID=3112940 RepID=UPI002E270940|nr:PEP-CTERM sorting domain-containing protein [Ideonella sp. BN130291]